MLHYFVKNSLLGEFQRIAVPRYKDVWIHAGNPTVSDVEEVSKHAGLNPNIVHDVTDPNELPRVEYDNGDLYVFTRIPVKDKHGHVTTSPLLSIVTKSAFITLSHDGNLDPSEIVKIKLKAKQDQSINLLINSIAHVVQAYENLIQETDHAVNDIGKRLRTHEVTNADFVRFVTIEGNLNVYKMNLNGLHVITQRLSENIHKSFHTSDTEALSDISLHIQELCAQIEGDSQTVVSIRNAYSTIANNTLNQRMKILTLLTVLIALPNVFYGMYGMNVALPFQNQPWAYAMVTGTTILIVIIVIAMVKKFKVF
jgi:magnesium transporter